MNIYEARWHNAKRIAEYINSMIDDGYIVFDEEGDRLIGRFDIADDKIVFRVNDNFAMIYFHNSPDWDEGYYTPIAEYNKQFAGWKCVAPKNIIGIDV